MARVWRRRRSLDTPRPAGRRWARLRRSGSRATQVFARVAGRGQRSSGGGTQVIHPRPFALRRVDRVVPVSPAPMGTAPLSAVPSGPVVVHPAGRPDPAGLAGDAYAPAGTATIPLLPGPRTFGRRIKFGIANGCTVGSLLLGMGAVFLAMHGDLRLAVVALLACVVLDGCDGGLARKFGVTSPFGAQMDSLADLSSFGVATGLVVYQWLVGSGANPLTAGASCALLAVCAAIRLARFNVSPKDGTFFCGVPTTMVAAVLALNMLIGPELPPRVETVFVAVYALAMVTSFPYVKLARVLRLPLWLWVVPAICAMISVPGTFAAVVGGYLISGPLLWLFRHTHRPRPALAP